MWQNQNSIPSLSDSELLAIKLSNNRIATEVSYVPQAQKMLYVKLKDCSNIVQSKKMIKLRKFFLKQGRKFLSLKQWNTTLADLT